MKDVYNTLLQWIQFGYTNNNNMGTENEQQTERKEQEITEQGRTGQEITEEERRYPLRVRKQTNRLTYYN